MRRFPASKTQFLFLFFPELLQTLNADGRDHIGGPWDVAGPWDHGTSWDRGFLELSRLIPAVCPS